MSLSNRSTWPQARIDLNQRLVTVIRSFIANDSFDDEAVRVFAKTVAQIEHDLAHLDALERKARALAS